jgi:hypothetical protein
MCRKILYEVWKERDRNWRFEIPDGIKTCRTKKQAMQEAELCRTSNEDSDPPHYFEICFKCSFVPISVETGICHKCGHSNRPMTKGELRKKTKEKMLRFPICE